jgi:hypothetical protein
MAQMPQEPFMTPPQIDPCVPSQKPTETCFSLTQLCQRDIRTLNAEVPVRKAVEMMGTHPGRSGRRVPGAARALMPA